MPRQINNQSDASKTIKRVNERIADITRLKSEDNPYISAYSRAIHELGLEFTKEESTNRYKIKNTAENRKKAQQLETLLEKYHAKTVGGITKQAKKELSKEAQAIGEKRAEEARAEALKAGKTTRQAYKAGQQAKKSFIKEHTSKEKVQQRVQENLEDVTIHDMLQVVYATMGDAGHELGAELQSLTKGIGWGDQDEGAIYDTQGRIREAYRQYQRGELQTATAQARKDTQGIYRNFRGGQ